MKVRMTYTLIHVLKCSPGKMGLLALLALSPNTLALATPPEGCAFHQVTEGLAEYGGSRALVATDRIPTMSYKAALNGGIPSLRNTPYYEFQTPDGGFITIVDLGSSKARSNPKVMQLLEAWDKKTDEELRRLPQFAHLPSGSFNSLDHPDRTAVIAKTAMSINDGDPEVQGGIRVVFTRNADETLPLHEDFPEERRVDNSAEPGRLSGSGYSTLFLHFAMRVIKESVGTTEIKVHTSESHHVLYRRAGARTNDIYKRDEKHWILRFGRMHVREVLRKTKKVLDISAG